jgi:hypothetical protein
VSRRNCQTAQRTKGANQILRLEEVAGSKLGEAHDLTSYGMSCGPRLPDTAGQNRKRVRPPGAVPKTAVAERGSMR